MVRTILLMKLTDQGVKDIKNAPQRIDQAIKTYEEMGGKMIGFYAVTGKYDYIAIGESPSDEVGMVFVMGLSALGNARTTTIRDSLPALCVDAVQTLTWNLARRWVASCLEARIAISP